MPIKAGEDHATDEDGTRPRMLFKGVSVFDRSHVARSTASRRRALDPASR
jgi:hypothetical protein